MKPTVLFYVGLFTLSVNCAYDFPDVEAEDRYRCESQSECIDGTRCENGFCTRRQKTNDDSAPLSLGCELTCGKHASCVLEDSISQCICNLGYLGDGLTCVVEVVPPICDEGYRLDLGLCTDVDECSEDLAFCDAHAECNNTLGSYECVCQEGYSGDGLTCDKDTIPPADPPVDPPEDPPIEGGCGDPPVLCDVNAECTKKGHSEKYTCECKTGFSGDGESCVAE